MKPAILQSVTFTKIFTKERVVSNLSAVFLTNYYTMRRKYIKLRIERMKISLKIRYGIVNFGKSILLLSPIIQKLLYG